MFIAQKHGHLPPRLPLSVFGRFTVGTLLVSAVLCAAIKLLVGKFGGPPFLVTISMLVFALVVATGIRWTILIGTLTIIGYLIAFYFQPFVAYHLTQPKVDFALFVIILLLVVDLLLGLGTSIGAFVQNYFQHERLTPRWFSSVLTGVAGLAIGAILIAALSQGTTANVSTGTTYTNGVPTVHMGIDNFLQPSVTIAKGSKLLLVDDGAYNHVLANGSWVNGQPQPEDQSGAPTVNNLSVNGSGKSLTIGPFTTAGTYSIYCSIHRGMMLTVLVQ